MHISLVVKRMSCFCIPKFFSFSNNASFNDPAFKYLNDIAYNDTIPFIPPVECGKVVKVYDGDTITVASKILKGKDLYRFSVRLNGIDSPEIKGKSDAEKTSAILSRDKLSDLIFNKVVRLEDVKTEKYGRILAEVYLDDLHINKWMVDNKLAIPYDGGTKKNFTEFYL